MILSVFIILFGYLTFQQHQEDPRAKPPILAEDVRVSSTSVMESQAELHIWNHGDRLAYYSAGTVGLVAPRGKGQVMYQSEPRTFIDASGTYVITSDQAGVHVTSRSNSFLLPNANGENSLFFHLWHKGLLYYTYSSRNIDAPMFGGLFALDLVTGKSNEIVPASPYYVGLGFDVSPDGKKVVLVMEDHRDPTLTIKPQVIWIHDFINSSTWAGAALPSPDGYGKNKASHGRPYWINPFLLAIDIYDAEGSGHIGVAFYRISGETLVVQDFFPGAIRLLEDRSGGQLFLLVRKQHLVESAVSSQYELWKYDFTEGRGDRIVSFSPGHEVTQALINEIDGRLAVAVRFAMKAEDGGLARVSLVHMDGRFFPMLSAKGTISAAAWVGDTLYVTTFSNDRYTLNRIRLSKR